jgi:hypothetical protein
MVADRTLLHPLAKLAHRLASASHQADSTENLLTEQLIIGILSSTTSRYIVTTHRRIDDPEEFTIDLLAANAASAGQQTADLVRQAIGTSELRIRSHAADDSPCRAELASIAAPMDAREQALSASTHIVMDSETSPARQPHRARLIRHAARALADATDGQLADPCTAQLVHPDRRVDGERDWFCPADGWLGIDCHINPDGGQDTTGPAECECLCLFTRGLSRFGLPDLAIDRVPCAYDLAATNAMRGLAVRMLALLWADPDARELRLEKSIIIEPEDVWGYWGAWPLFGLPVPVSLAPANRDDLPASPHLELLPRPDFPGTRPEWAAQVLGEGVSSVAGWQPDTPPYRIDRQAAIDIYPADQRC